MEPEQIDRAISQVGAEDEPEEAKERFRDLRLNPHEEGKQTAIKAFAALHRL